MPDYDNRLRVPVPLPGEATDLKAILKAIVVPLGAAGAPIVGTVSERNAQYGTDKPGSIVVTTSPIAVWIKLSDTNEWTAIYSDTGWKTVTLLNGWTSPGPFMYRVLNGVCYWRSILVGPEGLPSKTVSKICNVPTEAQPASNRMRWAVNTRSSVEANIEIAAGEMTGWFDVTSNAYIGVPGPYPVD